MGSAKTVAQCIFGNKRAAQLHVYLWYLHPPRLARDRRETDSRYAESAENEMKSTRRNDANVSLVGL